MTGMDVRTLRWFQQVADGTTLTGIGEQERISQPGITRALHRLERELGATLLRRTGRTLALTPAGAAFRRHVDAALHHLDDGVAAVEQMLDPDTGTVVVTFEPSLGTWLIPDLVRSFRREYPDVVLDLRTKTEELVPGTGADSDVDLELSTLHPPSVSHAWRRLIGEPLQLVVAHDDPLAGAAGTTLADLADQPFVATRPGTLLRRQFDDLCRVAAFVPAVALVADDLATLHGYVAAGLGIAVAPPPHASSVETGAPPAQALHRVAILDAGADREVGLSWPLGRRALPSAVLLREHVLTRARVGGLG
jgi:LysR family transcriptional activator of glutamate synthase operon